MAAEYYNRQKAFIESQIRTLEQPLEASIDWHDGYESPDEGSLAPALIYNVLSRLNASNKKRYRELFSHQSVRRICQQLQALKYDFNKDADVVVVQNTASSLLSSWPDQAASEEDLERYSSLKSNVDNLQAKLDDLQKKYDRYKILSADLNAMQTANIQHNLDNNDNSAISSEMEKSRLLIPKLLSTIETQKASIAAKRKQNAADQQTSKRARSANETAVQQLLDMLKS